MLLAGILLGLIAGLAAGGRLDNLLAVRLRWTLLIFVALAVRLGTEAALLREVALADQLRLPLLAAGFGVLVVALWVNRRLPGIGLALVGTALNATAILVNGGFMPVWDQALAAAGLTPAEIVSPIHFVIAADPPLEFLRQAGPLGDVIPLPLALLPNVFSIGDIMLAAGLAFFLFASLQRDPRPAEGTSSVVDGAVAVATASAVAAGAGRRVRPATGLASSLTETIGLERSIFLGGSAAGVAVPAPTPTPDAPGGLRAARRGVLARALGHPYVRLAQNGSFGALWTGQLISLFGDRLHQLALVALVGEATQNGAFAVAMVFVAATVPNLVVGPLAGALVDRWDQKRVMIASDLLRAALVLLIPAAATVNILLVYPLVFGVTTVSLFSRPARTAVIPRIVKDDELVAANSAIWLGDSLADVVGYPLAALFVAFLGGSLALAFWVDAVTYLASAALLVTMVIPAVIRTAAAAVPGLRGLLDDLVAGWRFLRGEPVLLANTVQATVAQFSIGVTIGIMAIYAREAISSDLLDERARYGFIEMAIGVGNLVGGFVVGLVGSRLAKGPLVIIGYVGYGVGVAALALTGNLGVALALTLGMGVANMVFVIPTQALFMERTPNEMIGRVIAFRFSAVFGSMTIAMAVGGLMSEMLGPSMVFAIFGVLTVLAGLAGLLSRPLREA
ncbi:MAG TPA: MFS transporter [Patescibacteria group bacterium]|nr:MFS transporter [Patescibacteria group bacterium]